MQTPDRTRVRRKDSEEGTRRATVEDRYRVLFDENPMPMWAYDVDTLRFIDVNDAAIRHYGYSREEFL